MISTFVCSYLNGPSISKWRTFKLHSDYAECMHLGSEFPYIAYEWPTKTSALLDLPSGSPGKEAQVARYRTKYEDEYDPFSATKPSSTSLHTVVLFGWSLNRFNGLVPCGKVIPAMKKLKLVDFPWGTSVDELPLLWDFSRLRCLSFRGSQICQFGSGVPVEALSELRAFKVQDCFLIYQKDKAIVKRFLVAILESCRYLESFKLNGVDWQDYLLMDSIAKIGTQLRKLRLTGDYANRPPPKRFLVNGLEEYPNLVDLGLGLDVRNEDVSQHFSLSSWCAKRSLHSITASGSLAYFLTDVRVPRHLSSSSGFEKPQPFRN